MKLLEEERIFNCSADVLWSILSDVSRCDWVPSVEKITLDRDCRFFKMAGMGRIVERILLLDNETMTLQYSAIETPAPVDHHRATMNVLEVDEDHCQLEWKTEIDPETFADGVHQGMVTSLQGIESLLRKV